jgi:hypothetical protein
VLVADGDLDLWARLADEGLPLVGGGMVRTRWAFGPQELPRSVDLNDLLASLLSEQQQTGAAEPPTDEAFLAALVGLTVRGTLAELADHGAVTIAGASLRASQLPAPATALQAIGTPQVVAYALRGMAPSRLSSNPASSPSPS